MKRKNQDIPKWILTNKEESKLSEKDKSDYYHKLREYCLERKLINTTAGATVIGPKLKKPTNYIARKLCDFLGAERLK